MGTSSLAADIKGKRVLIFQQRGWALNVGQGIAEKLHDMQAKLSAYTIKKSTHRFVMESEIPYEHVVNYEDVLENLENTPGIENITLDEICKDLQLESVWPLLAMERKFVKSYRGGYYYSFRQNLLDEKLELIIKAFYLHFKKLFDAHTPDLIIMPVFGSTTHLLVRQFALKHGNIPMISITSTGLSGYRAFANEKGDRCFDFEEHYTLLMKGAIKSPSTKEAKEYVSTMREKLLLQKTFLKPYQEKMISFAGIWQEIKAFKTVCKKILRDMVKGHENYIEGLGPTIDYLPPFYRFRDHFALRWNRYKARRLDYYALKETDQFVYFPLQVQPEATVDVLATYFNNMLEVIRLTAQSLPGDLKLIVKEHPNFVGMRKESYYKKIMQLPNVKLVKFNTSQRELMKRCAMVVSVGISTPVEAAFYDKPTITFNEFYPSRLLPHVHYHTDFTTLSAQMKKMMAENYDQKKYRDALQHYVETVLDRAFKRNYDELWEGAKKYDFQPFWERFEEELERIFATSKKEKKYA